MLRLKSQKVHFKQHKNKLVGNNIIHSDDIRLLSFIMNIKTPRFMMVRFPQPILHNSFQEVWRKLSTEMFWFWMVEVFAFWLAFELVIDESFSQCWRTFFMQGKGFFKSSKLASLEDGLSQHSLLMTYIRSI